VRVFLDTNVLVSAFASRGLCADLLELVLLEHDLITGQHVLRELAKALHRTLKLPVSRAAEVVQFVSGDATQVVRRPKAARADVDSDDALVLGEAVAGRSDVFVTGDGRLLGLPSVEQLRIVSPRQLWEVLRRGEE
jgi:uncharacterized protein